MHVGAPNPVPCSLTTMTELPLDLPSAFRARTARLRHDASTLGREAWLTGLGVLALVEDEGSTVVETIGARRAALAKRGLTIEPRLDERMRSVRERVNVRGRGRAITERVESAVVGPISGAFERLGVPSRAEVRELSAKVDRLTMRVNLLIEKLAPQTAEVVELG
jgi:poly(hydroxyalkanoate) granule-associated protein